MKESIMKRTALGLAGVAAAGIAVAVPAMGQSQTPGPRTISLIARTTSVKLADPRDRPAAGDVLVAVNVLRNPGGGRAGTGHLSCIITRPARTFGRSTYHCTGTNRLRDGSLSFSLIARLGVDRVVRAAVTGGTGAYSGARGEAVNTTRSENVSTQVISLAE
jgi:hypothetical protein